MRTIFFLGRRSPQDGETEVVHLFGTRRPDRAEIRLRHAEFPQANVLASYPDVEDERRFQIKVIHELPSAA